MEWRRQTHPPVAEANPFPRNAYHGGGTWAGLPSIGIQTVMDDPPIPKTSQSDRDVKMWVIHRALVREISRNERGTRYLAVVVTAVH
jgi:hypothetical protein